MTLFGAIDSRKDPVLSHNFLIALVESGSTMALSGSDAISAINNVFNAASEPL